MEDNPEGTGPQAQGTPSPRRRFLKHGLAGGAALWLASTQHAVAKGGAKCGMLSKSGHQSAVKNAHTSAGGKGKKFCPGKSTRTWAQGTGWPSGCHPTKSGNTQPTKFTDCFTTSYSPTNCGFKSTDTLFTCVGGASSNAAVQFAGAYLNAVGGASNYPYTAQGIVHIWQTNYHNSSALTAYANYFSQYLNVS